MPPLRARVRIAILGILVAVGVSGCLSAESWEAVRVLEDIEAGHGPSALKRETPAPVRREVAFAIDGRRHVADIYTPEQPVGARLILVPGFTPAGKDDSRVVALANSLGRARFRVLVPNIPGSRDLRVSTADARAIADGVLYMAALEGADGDRPLGIAAISYAVGPAILAGLTDDAGDEVDFILALGGYHDTTAVITFMTTGGYRDGTTWQFAAPYPTSKWIFLAGNAEAVESPADRALLETIAERRRVDPDAPIDDLAVRLGPEGRALLDLMTNRDPDRVAVLIDRLSGPVRQRIAALSLAPLDLTSLAGRLILIHGRADRMIPYTESRALAAAAGAAKLFLVGDFSHIEPSTVGWLGRLTLIDAMQALLQRRKD
jgi:hypothetical protein